MTTSYLKVHSPAKNVVTIQHGNLSGIVRKTLSIIREAVGGTLGPGGRLVLIEQQELGLPNILTKDGVTVFRALGFNEPTMHVVMEIARDSATRTATDAGDGTTTATILAEALNRLTGDFCEAHPAVSPQRVIKTIQGVFEDLLEPEIRSCSMKANFATRNGRKMLKNVALVSANGDEPLADAVLECFELVGDDGNVTLSEVAGPSEYRVDKVEGFPIGRGYDESCNKFYPAFLNDRVNQRCYLENPCYILYFGVVNDIMTVAGITGAAWTSWQTKGTTQNVVLVATGFSEQVLGYLAGSFGDGRSLQVVPLLVPMSPIPNGQQHFLEDLSAVTGATVYDQLQRPMPGPNVPLYDPDSGQQQSEDAFDVRNLGGTASIEVLRSRSTILGKWNDEDVLERAEELRGQIATAESVLDKAILEERLGKLTGGIARLTVVGASAGEIREGKDRAEDAVRAVQGAMLHGCLPGGCWTLLRLAELLAMEDDEDGIYKEVLIPALQEPFQTLMKNLGESEAGTADKMHRVGMNAICVKSRNAEVFDALNQKFVSAVKAGILDSTPAVLEALRNSLSIATRLGTLGACVTFQRDHQLERDEARSTYDFNRSAGINEADERS